VPRLRRADFGAILPAFGFGRVLHVLQEDVGLFADPAALFIMQRPTASTAACSLRRLVVEVW